LRAIWHARFHPGRKAIERAGLDSLLDRDWGFDSLSRAELLLRTERAFATHLPEQLLGEAESLRDLAEALSGARASSSVAQIHPLHTPAPEAAEPAPDSAATLTDVLDWHVQERGERVHVVVMEGDGRESPLSYRQVSERAHAVARGLQQRGLQAGERVALMLPTGEAFFAAFFGILYAGGVPCPIYPPARLSRIEEHLQRQAGILDNARAAMLIAPPEAAAVARLLRLQVESLRSLETVDELASFPAKAHSYRRYRRDARPCRPTWRSCSTRREAPAIPRAWFSPNIRAMGEAMEAGSRDVFVSWLPLYHDMGLIGAWLGSLYFAAPACDSATPTHTRRYRHRSANRRHMGELHSLSHTRVRCCRRVHRRGQPAGRYHRLARTRALAERSAPVPQTCWGKWGSA
jgi:acyl carrier protein